MRQAPGRGQHKRAEERRGLKVVGTVVSGLGESGPFLAIPWVENQIVEKLGFVPYCGTLNIDVHDPDVQRTLKKHSHSRIVPQEKGFCDALAMTGTIGNRYPCGIILPLVENYPECILEIVAPVHLKEALQVKDGDEIEVEVFA